MVKGQRPFGAKLHETLKRFGVSETVRLETSPPKNGNVNRNIIYVMSHGSGLNSSLTMINFDSNSNFPMRFV